MTRNFTVSVDIRYVFLYIMEGIPPINYLVFGNGVGNVALAHTHTLSYEELSSHGFTV